MDVVKKKEKVSKYPVEMAFNKLVRYDDKGNLKSLAFGTIHNELNESFIPKLTQFDTLAVKEYRIKYSVK